MCIGGPIGHLDYKLVWFANRFLTSLQHLGTIVLDAFREGPHLSSDRRIRYKSIASRPPHISSWGCKSGVHKNVGAKGREREGDVSD